MESKLHKHFKNNLICKGMKILSCGKLLTIEDFSTEVNLNKYFNTDWNKTIIVDILAKTNKGYIAIEIYNTSPKVWSDLSYYYNELSDKIINFFEVKVYDTANMSPEWKDKQLLLKENCEIEFIDKNTFIGDFYFGSNSKPFKVNNTLYQVKCVHRESTYSKYTNIITMQFDMSNKYITEKRIFTCFGAITGLVKSEFKYIRISDKLYQCVSFYNPRNTGYSKYDQTTISKIRRQLDKMKPQSKIVYARSN